MVYYVKLINVYYANKKKTIQSDIDESVKGLKIIDLI